MSIKNIIQSATNSSFNVLKEFKKDVIVSIETGEYNSNTAIFDSFTSNTTLEAIVTSFSKNDIYLSGGKILSDDLKVIINNTANTSIDLDNMLYIDSERYNIIAPIRNDISGSITILQARK